MPYTGKACNHCLLKSKPLTNRFLTYIQILLKGVCETHVRRRKLEGDRELCFWGVVIKFSAVSQQLITETGIWGLTSDLSLVFCLFATPQSCVSSQYNLYFFFSNICCYKTFFYSLTGDLPTWAHWGLVLGLKEHVNSMIQVNECSRDFIQPLNCLCGLNGIQKGEQFGGECCFFFPYRDHS